MKNIALGQYYPSGSVIHRLDGRIKIILSLAYIICTFLCRSAASFVFLFVGTLCLTAIAKIPFRIIMRSVRGIIFILIFTFAINMFFTKGEGEPLFEWRYRSLPRGHLDCGLYRSPYTCAHNRKQYFHVVYDNADRAYGLSRESALAA